MQCTPLGAGGEGVQEELEMDRKLKTNARGSELHNRSREARGSHWQGCAPWGRVRLGPCDTDSAQRCLSTGGCRFSATPILIKDQSLLCILYLSDGAWKYHAPISFL